jgi:hypothetical protein
VNERSAKLETGNKFNFVAFVQDAGKDLVRFAKVARRTKGSHNYANLLGRYPNANNPLPVVGSHSYHAQACFFVRLESLP